MTAGAAMVPLADQTETGIRAVAVALRANGPGRDVGKCIGYRVTWMLRCFR